MNEHRRPRTAGGAVLLACAIAGSGTSTLAAADTVDPAAPAANGGSAAATVLVVGKPSVTDLGPVADRSSPQSYVGAQAIQQLQSPFADYGNIANLTPSYVSSAPNGAGWDAAKNQSLRGFTDGQFNVTVDGIPLQDPDTLGHHSTSWFPAMTLGGIRVDRSPGGATDVGYATFGGTLDQQTVEVPKAAGMRLFGSRGSFDTWQTGVRLASGPVAGTGTAGVALVEHDETAGGVTNASGRKDTLMFKTATQLGDQGKLTLLYFHDKYFFYNPPNTTTDNVANLGPRYAFGNDPTRADDYRWQATDRTTNFGYARLQLGGTAGWSLDDKLYYYTYGNQGLALKGDETSSTVGDGFGVPATDIGGRFADENYRTLGNILQADIVVPQGHVRGGVWLETSHESYTRVGEDLTTGRLYDVNKDGGNPFYFDFDSSLKTVQPFAEYEWHPNADITLRPGLRWQRVTRGFDAAIVQNFLPGTDGNVKRSTTATLPSLDARWNSDAQTQWYAQWSKGALLPSQSFFYTADPQQGNQAQPQTSKAIQVGVIRSGQTYAFAIDAYRISFDNYIAATTVDNDTVYTNAGGVLYRGLEAEGSVALLPWLRAFGNYSLLRATFQDSGMTSAQQQSGDTIPLAPRYTGLTGLAVETGPWSASLYAKFVGSQYQGKNGSSDGEAFRVPAYSYTNAALWYSLEPSTLAHSVRLGVGVDNLWDSHSITDTAGPSKAGPQLINVLPVRSYRFMVTADFG